MTQADLDLDHRNTLGDKCRQIWNSGNPSRPDLLCFSQISPEYHAHAPKNDRR